MSKTTLTIILTSTFIFISLIGNIAATKITYLGPLVMDAGFIYALLFTWRDLIHKQLGKQAALTTIYISSILNLIAALYFQLVIALPAETTWSAAGGQTAWEFLFNLQFRILIASIIAQLISEIADTATYQWWTSGLGKNKPQWLRVVISNSISIPLDSLLFPIIAFAAILPFSVLQDMFLTNIIVKAVLSLATAWLIYLIPSQPLYKTSH